MFPQILASDQKILKITNLNNSKPAYQPPIVFKGIIQPFCLSYIFSTFMRTDSCSNNFRAETTKLWHKMRSAKNSVQHATWKASHPTQVGRKWRNGNVIYLKFCLVIRDLLKKNCASLLSKADFVCTNSVEALQDFTSLRMVFHMNWAFHNSRKFALYYDFLKISGYL